MRNRIAPIPRLASGYLLWTDEEFLEKTEPVIYDLELGGFPCSAFLKKENCLSRFGSDPLSFFNALYEDIPPWEIGKAQPAMTALLARFPPAGPVLDVGCGSGDLSIYLASLGYETLGIDFVEAAVASAREKLTSLPPETARLVNFVVAEALRPSLLQRQFGAIVDSGFFHLFDPEQCDRYAEELALTLISGGRYYLHAFDIEFPISSMPRRIPAEELRTRFTVEKGWRIKQIQSVEFLSRVAPPVPAICACIERLHP
jgi:SAM-dependent methyltransferase